MSLARLLAIDVVAEQLAEDEVAEQLDEFIGEVYDPTEEFK